MYSLPCKLHIIKYTTQVALTQKRSSKQAKGQVNGNHAVKGVRRRLIPYTERCQRLVAGGCPHFPSLAQIFPGSDTSYALSSLLHVARNKRRVGPTVFKWKRMDFKVWWWGLLNFSESKMHLFVKSLWKTCFTSQLFGSMMLNVLQLVSRSDGEHIYLVWGFCSNKTIIHMLNLTQRKHGFESW